MTDDGSRSGGNTTTQPSAASTCRRLFINRTAHATEPEHHRNIAVMNNHCCQLCDWLLAPAVVAAVRTPATRVIDGVNLTPAVEATGSGTKPASFDTSTVFGSLQFAASVMPDVEDGALNASSSTNRLVRASNGSSWLDSTTDG